MPKRAVSHDRLFKWVITAFLDEFFLLFFPGIRIQKHRLMDKEFFHRLGSAGPSYEADLLIMAELMIEGKYWHTMILIELKSRRIMALDQIRHYVLSACLVTDLPVWPLLLFTDDTVWTTPLEDRFPLTFHSVEGFTQIPCDIIRLKDCKSEDLIRRHSLLAKLFALKADGGTDNPKELVSDIYGFLRDHNEHLTKTQKAAAERFVAAYANLEPEHIEAIKREVDMKWMGNTIDEYYTIIGEERGEKRGEKRGLSIGLIQGELNTLDRMLKEGKIDHAYYAKACAPLHKKLAKIEMTVNAKRRPKASPSTI